VAGPAEAADGVLVVVNRAARGGALALVDEIERGCRAVGCDPVTVVPDGPAGVAATIGEAVGAGGSWRAVLAVGGDGTVRTCATALAGSDLPMAIVPAGTGNSLYRALWEDRPWPEVLTSVLTGGARVRDLDLLAVRGADSGTTAVAMLGVSAGLVAEVVRASEGLTGVSGRDRYAAAAGVALEGHQPFPARVVLDGGPLADGPVSLVAVGGARHRSGTFQLLPRSVLDDGRLDVCVIGGVDAAGFVDLAGAVVAGEHLGRPGVAYGQGTSVRIERTDDEPLALEHDGDRWPADDRAVEAAVAGSVKVLAPVAPVAG
jgi:diacylglycerol kinase (ATP)